MQISARMHAGRVSARYMSSAGESERESTTRREGRVRESWKCKPRKTPVVWFSQRGTRRRNALGGSVMQAPSNYLQPYQEELGWREISAASYWAQIKPDKYISVMITNAEPYTTLISDKPQPLLIFQGNHIATAGFKCPWWRPWCMKWLPWVLMCIDLIYTDAHIIAVWMAVL